MLESSNQLYLKALVSLQLRNYSQAVEDVNNALKRYIVNECESIPFEVIKAMAFKNLGEDKEFKSILKNIRRLKPEFVLTEDMWQV